MIRTDSTRAILWTGGAVFAASFAFLGCLKANSEQVAKRYESAEELQPYATPYENAFLIAAGSPIETTVTANRADGRVEFLFTSNGVVLENEVYEYDVKSFRFMGKSSDQFTPGIPLLHFPLNLGDDWTWSGTNHFGKTDRKASATIKTREEKLNTVAGEFGTVRVDVSLSIESGSAKPVERLLSFWFAPRKGIVRREFENDYTREPMPPKAANGQP